jgi:hypothetical protein
MSRLRGADKLRNGLSGVDPIQKTEDVLKIPGKLLWRYLILPKFVSMLDSQSLYFCRVDRFEDPREAAVSQPVLEKGMAETLRRLSEEDPSNLTEDQAHEIALSVEAANEIFNREGAFANCWHQNDRESGPMWGVYGREGVVIRSTVGRLFAATRNDDFGVYIAPVTYIDHATEEMDPVWAFLYKHYLYRDEREYRAFVLHPPKTPSYEDPDPEHPLGIDIRVPLDQLLEAVQIAPGAGQMQKRVARSLLDHYGLPDIPVIPSVADTIPEYRESLEKTRLERRSKRR